MVDKDLKNLKQAWWVPDEDWWEKENNVALIQPLTVDEWYVHNYHYKSKYLRWPKNTWLLCI